MTKRIFLSAIICIMSFKSYAQDLGSPEISENRFSILKNKLGTIGDLDELRESLKKNRDYFSSDAGKRTLSIITGNKTTDTSNLISTIKTYLQYPDNIDPNDVSKLMETFFSGISLAMLAPDHTKIVVALNAETGVKVNKGYSLRIKTNKGQKKLDSPDFSIKAIAFNDVLFDKSSLNNTYVELTKSIEPQAGSSSLPLYVFFEMDKEFNGKKSFYTMALDLEITDENGTDNGVAAMYSKYIRIQKEEKKENTPLENGSALNPWDKTAIVICSSDPSLNRKIIDSISKIVVLNTAKGIATKEYSSNIPARFKDDRLLLDTGVFGSNLGIGASATYCIQVFTKYKYYQEPDGFLTVDNEHVAYQISLKIESKLNMDIFSPSINYAVIPVFGSEAKAIRFPLQIAPSIQLVDLTLQFDDPFLQKPIIAGAGLSLLLANSEIDSAELETGKYQTNMAFAAISLKVNMLEFGIAYPFWGTPVNPFAPGLDGYAQIHPNNFMLVMNIDLAKSLEIIKKE
jgi:hypothetical protein